MEPQSQPSLVLIASEGEWVGRSLASVFELNGYTVLRVESGRRALQLARRTSPDAILLEDSLTDVKAVDVCRALRDDPLFNHMTPIVIAAAAQHASRVRAEAYAAGAWEYCTQPVDVESLILKLATFIRARHEGEGARSRALVDQLTGLYSEYGLKQWGEQLGARALRKREAMACVVVMPAIANGDNIPLTAEQSSDALAQITDVCRAQSRRSDVVGYLGESRVAILAPDTDAPGVIRLIERLQQGLSESSSRSKEGRKTASLRAGYCVVPNLAAANLAPSELVRRAETALQRAHDVRGGTAAVSFDEVLLS